MAEPKAQTLLQKMGFKDNELSTPKHDEIMLWLDENIQTILDSFEWLPASAKTAIRYHRLTRIPDFSIRLHRVIWEHPVTTGHNAYIIGFIDLRVETKLVFDPAANLDEHEWPGPVLNFEVKTAIPSLGEFFRQINTYRKHLLTGSLVNEFIVVSPDDRFKKQIEAQHVHFLHYQ